MKARLAKPVKYDLSSRSSVFTPEIFSQKPKYYLVKFYRIPDSEILPHTGIGIRYIPSIFADEHLVLSYYF